MKIKRFFAPDIRQAMRMVKDELGADAVIMSNRAVDGGIEIVAARDFDEQSIHNKLQEQASARPAEPVIKNVVFPVLDQVKKPVQTQFQPDNNESDVTASLSPAAQKLAGKAPEPALAPQAPELRSSPRRTALPNFEGAKKRLQRENDRKAAAVAALAANPPARKFTSPYVGYAEKAELIKNTEVLAAKSPPLQAAPKPALARHLVSDPAPVSAPAATAVSEKSPALAESLLLEMSKELKQLRSAMDSKFATISWAVNPQRASHRNELKERLLRMGVSKKLSAAIAGQIADQQDAEQAFSKAQGLLAQALPIADDSLLETGGVVALVGPTGVGKTTTIAKLAAKFILKHGSGQVALITTDNYRIGAHDQLNTYGRILNIPVRVASCADDLKSIINGFANKRLILIDTAGMCQRDMKLIEQINTLQQHDLPIRSYLVMSAATEYKAMKEVIKAFSVFDLQAAILTKLDEAVLTAPALSSLIEHNLSLSFIADGQQVPEDFHQPDARALIGQCVAEAGALEDEDEEDMDLQSWGAQAYA